MENNLIYKQSIPITFLFFLSVIISIPFFSAAHYIIGFVFDGSDGTSANGHTIVLWNPLKNINDNQTDIIGPTGNSNTNNIYMIDCEMLNNSCKIGDKMSLKVVDNGDNHYSNITNVTVSSAGFDVANNLSLTSPLNITNLSVDDSILSPPNQIDLVVAGNQTVLCTAIVRSYDGNFVANSSAEFFSLVYSHNGDSDNNNFHYSNITCFINSSYGPSKTQIICGFSLKYYSYPGSWKCSMNVTDDNFNIVNSTVQTNVNSLLAIGVDDSIDYGNLSQGNVSSEKIINVTNYGNVKINLSLSGYGYYVDDGNAMNCTLGSTKNISIMYEKYNLTSTNLANNLVQFQANYTNLTTAVAVKTFNLNVRTNDLINDAINSTYWRIYVPNTIAGNCRGNIVFGASASAGN